MGQSQHGKSPASEVRQIQVLPSMCRNFEARPQALGASVSSTLKWNDNHVVLLRSQCPEGRKLVLLNGVHKLSLQLGAGNTNVPSLRSSGGGRPFCVMGDIYSKLQEHRGKNQ